MKLYTEEQVREIMKSTHIHTDNDVDMILPQFTPISLPSDEEVEDNAKNYANLIGNKNGTSIFDYVRGAKWMRDKIILNK